jgi:hypothetical protein
MVVALATSPPRDSTPTALAALMADFAAPTPDLLGKRELLRRVDTKYLLGGASLARVLAGLDQHYAAFRVATGCVATYESLYFDTPELVCFHDHRRGRRLRNKIRIRHYPDREVSYLEIKAKQTDVLTHKYRLEVPFRSETIGDAELAFLRAHLGPFADLLRPELRINYKRIGLLALDTSERVTIDLDLCFVTTDGRIHEVGDAIVLEVKQSATSRSTPIARSLAAIGAREQALSKYTTAIAMMRPEVRNNRLRLTLRALERTLR